MKGFAILLVLVVFQSFVSANYAQVAKISLEAKTRTIKEVLNEIENKSEFYFTYDAGLIDTKKKVSIKADNQNVKQVLDQLFENEPVSYEIKDKHIVLYKDAKSKTPDRDEVEQSRQISGIVKDNSGETVIGATIVLKNNKTTGTISDIDGKFSISVPDNAILLISCIGYVSQEIKIKNQTSLNVVLVEDAKMLDEFVVVGYGVQKKGNLTAAISTLKADDIVTGTSVSLAQKIQGKIPGLQIRNQSGEPGTFNSTINIRGFGDALYVIDGIVRNDATEFQQLNPNDIENISILKDASAAVYGLDAANGVILVTTKRGQAGRPKFNYSGVAGWQSPTARPKMSNAAQYKEMHNEAIFYRDGTHAITKDELEKWKAGGLGYESTDWYDETMKKSAMQQNHDFSVRGGNDVVDYFVSFGYFNDNGLFKSNDMSYNRYNLRSNLTAKLSKHLKAEVMLAGRYSVRDFPGGDGFMWTYKGTMISMPYEKPYIDGNPQYPANIKNQENPVLMSQKKYAGYTQDKSKSFQSSASLIYDAPFLPGLQAKGTIAYDSYNVFNKNVWKNYQIYSQDLSSTTKNAPRIANRTEDLDRLVMQAQLSYNKTFLEDHNVAGTFVFETKSLRKKHAELKREYDFFTNDVVDYALGLQTNAGGEQEENNMSYIGRFNYDYKGKYLAEFAFRYDGSYRYAPGSRWGFFPAVSAGWRISEESFFKNNIKFVDNMKFRGSYGEIGQNTGDGFNFVPGFSPAIHKDSKRIEGAEFENGRLNGGLYAPGVINPNLTWEKSKIMDIGFELSVLNNMFGFEFDYYQRDKSGKLKRRESGTGLPNTFGGAMPEENLESERTRGFDFVLNHQHKIDKVNYGVSFNLNLARTMHREVDKPDPRSSYDKWRHAYTNRWNDMEWGWDKTGQFQNFEDIYNGVVHGDDQYQGNGQLLPGDYVYEDVNGDGIIDGKDQQPIFRNRTPKLFYGFTLYADWNNFDVSALFQGAALYTIKFDEVYSQMFFNDGNLPAYFHDRWHLEDVYNPNSAWVPGKWAPTRYSENMRSSYRPSSMMFMNAAFLRLKNLEVGYTIPSKVTKKYMMDRVRIYANATNFLTFTDSFLKQFDPEKYEGKDYKGGYDYPLTKSFNIGVNISF